MKQYIAIDGHSGSGKTHISALLADRINARVFNLDDYGNDFEPFVGIPSLIEALRKVESGTIIYEGVGVFDQRFDEFKPYRIFIDTADHIRDKRVRNRDVPREDRTVDDWQKIFAIWEKPERDYFNSNIKVSADLIINNDDEADIDSIVKNLHAFWANK